jgi:hypothetical protein
MVCGRRSGTRISLAKIAKIAKEEEKNSEL